MGQEAGQLSVVQLVLQLQGLLPLLWAGPSSLTKEKPRVGVGWRASVLRILCCFSTSGYHQDLGKEDSRLGVLEVQRLGHSSKGPLTLPLNTTLSSPNLGVQEKAGPEVSLPLASPFPWCMSGEGGRGKTAFPRPTFAAY